MLGFGPLSSAPISATPAAAALAELSLNLAVTLDALTAASTVDNATALNSATTLGALTLGATVDEAIAASAGATLGDVTAASTVDTAVQASTIVTLDALTSSSASDYSIAIVSTITLDDLALNSLLFVVPLFDDTYQGSGADTPRAAEQEVLEPVAQEVLEVVPEKTEPERKHVFVAVPAPAPVRVVAGTVSTRTLRRKKASVGFPPVQLRTVTSIPTVEAKDWRDDPAIMEAIDAFYEAEAYEDLTETLAAVAILFEELAA